ncbi:prevent-host-death family protein [Trueperella bonasi]|uniref:Prevent-host-death family protein n=1 Tax=Trueperella bonasi TaxID=312286 RepID=A0ABT9NED8_9ACTO|nr:type II toxin-antitoxin system prevent-host-death family antitoxin [Trueperella bonasi]MDP9805749.1 prevent-host-death family protein [Trueperella bonasi]
MSQTFTSGEIDRDLTAAIRATEKGPVTITDNGLPSHVLLTIEDFEHLKGQKELMGDRLWKDQDYAIELPIPERQIRQVRDIGL